MNLSESELSLEKEHLDNTLKLLRSQISELGQELYDDEEKQKEFKRYVWDTKQELDPTEMKTILSNNDKEIHMLERKANYYKKLYKIQNSPYFGKIIFDDEYGKNIIYIGLTYLTDSNNENIIFDWRSPISSIFYDYEQGKCSYETPSGKIDGYLKNKRQFAIENAKIVRAFDTSLTIQDEILQEVLSKRNNDYMKNIVNTIQTEQNAIIRNTTDRNLIVQGIAGSGKTSVALHRIAFLLYKIKNLTSDKVLIFAPNHVFSEYISNVLPELGEENTKETTFSDFLKHYIKEYDDIEEFTLFIERYYKYNEPLIDLVKYKQSNEVIGVMNEYINNLTKKARFTNDISFQTMYINKDELNYYLTQRYSSIPLFERINELSSKLSEQNFNGNKTRTKQIYSLLKNNLNINLDIKRIYKEFYNSNEFISSFKKSIPNSYITRLNGKTIFYEDACLFVYMRLLLEFPSYDYITEETIVDEAQDYSILQYMLLKKILRKSNFTILGDVNQTINPYYKYTSLNELKELFDDSTYLELNKTYRSSKEIVEETNKILGLTHSSAIRRNESIPVVFKIEKDLSSDLECDINLLMKSNKSIAIITKTDDEANYIYSILKKKYNDILLINNATKVFSRSLVVIPSYMSKGLEFDASIIYTKKNNIYTNNEKYLYYVACTRSQHNLIIYNQKA